MSDAPARISVAPVSGAALNDALDALLPAEPHLDYANFQPVAERPGAAQRLHRNRWLAEEDRIVALLACDADRRPLALLRVLARPFESDHFGLRMAKIECPIASAALDERVGALRRMYQAACARLCEAGYHHVAIRAATRDAAAGWAAQEAGALHVDTQVSWMCPLTRMPYDEAVPSDLVIEPHDRGSIAQLPRQAWERISGWAGEAFDRGPLVFDFTLPRARARAVYQEWAARVMTGRWADAVLVVRRRDEVVAFISMLRMDDVSEAAGAVVCGRGLGATLPEYRGLFTALQREMIARRPLGADFMENETQVSTIGSINVYAKLGMRYLRATSTYHRRLDGRVPEPTP